MSRADRAVAWTCAYALAACMVFAAGVQTAHFFNRLAELERRADMCEAMQCEHVHEVSKDFLPPNPKGKLDHVKNSEAPK